MNYIYALCDPINNKIRYIGQTNDLKRRYSQHCNEKNDTYKCNWIKSLKQLNLKPIMTIIGEYTEDTIDIWEIFWINYYSQIGCKLTNLDSGGNKHKIVSEETKRKISENKKGKKLSSETKIKMSNAHKGNTYCLGNKQSEETINKRKMVGEKNPFYSIGPMKGKFGKNHHASKPVAKLDKITLEIIEIFDSISDASRITNIQRTNINFCCKFDTKSAGGFKWRYVND